MPPRLKQDDYYEIDGVKYPRVTRILQVIEKPGLARWRGRVGNLEADRKQVEGSDFGTRFHEVCGEIHQGMHMQRGWQPPGDMRHMAFNYISWLHQNVKDIIIQEQVVHSIEHGYAGKPDLVARLLDDKLPSVVDIKTSKYPSIDWPLQLTAYREALAEEGHATERRLIVQVMKTPPYDILMYEYTDHEGDAEVWRNVLNYWRWTLDDKIRQKHALKSELLTIPSRSEPD